MSENPRQTHHLLPADTHQAIQERSESRHSDRSDEISELNMLGDDAQSTHHLGAVDRVNATHRKDGDKEQQHDDDAYRFRHPVVEGIVFRVRGAWRQSLAFTTTIIPAASFPLSSLERLVKSIRTGMRCCIFTKFPAELSVGNQRIFRTRSPPK